MSLLLDGDVFVVHLTEAGPPRRSDDLAAHSWWKVPLEATLADGRTVTHWWHANTRSALTARLADLEAERGRPANPTWQAAREGWIIESISLTGRPDSLRDRWLAAVEAWEATSR